MVPSPAGEQSVHSIVGSGIADGVDALIAPFNVVTHFNQLGYQRLGFLIFLRNRSFRVHRQSASLFQMDLLAIGAGLEFNEFPSGVFRSLIALSDGIASLN